MGSMGIVEARRTRRAGWLAGAAAIMLVLGAAPATAAEPTIATYAGELPSGLPGPSVSVAPSALAFAPNGDLYIADPGLGVIWRLGPDGTIHHFAGNGRQCLPTPALCNGIPGPAATAYLNTPSGLAVAPDGDVYVSEMRAQIVRRIDAQTGTISTVAGNGSTEFDASDDGGPATEASLWLPGSLALDSKRNLYIADINHGRIRRVTQDGTIETVAGCGRNQSQDFSCFHTVRDGSPIETTYIGANAGINGNGWGLAVSPDDELYIADFASIIRVDEEQGVYRVIAGTPTVYASFPGEGEGGPASEAKFGVTVAMAFAPDGDLYLVEGGGANVQPWNRIQKIDGPVTPASNVRHVGGCCQGTGFSGDGGPATKAAFNFAQPTGTWSGQGIAVSPSGDVFVSDVRNYRVRRIDGQSNIVTTAAGNGHGGAMYYMIGINDLHPFGSIPEGLTSRGSFSGDGGPVERAQFYGPADVEVDRDGNLYILDRYAQRVRRVSAVTGVITTVAGSGCVGADCWDAHRNAPLGDGKPADQAQLINPLGIEMDRTGTQLYIADSYNSRVRQVNLGKSPFTVYPIGQRPVTIEPGDIATVFGPGTAVNLPISVPLIGTVFQGCHILRPECGEGLHALDHASNRITDVAADAAGNLYVSDAGANQVWKADATTGIVTTLVGAPFASNCATAPENGLPGRATRLCGPASLHYHDDNLYISEANDYGFVESLSAGIGLRASRIRKVDLADPLARSSVIAGVGAIGHSGDGGAATAAKIAFPHGVVVAPDGSLYFADTGNSRIRRIAPDGKISTIAGVGSYEPSSFDFSGCDLSGDGGQASAASLCAPLGLAFAQDGGLLVADALNNRIRTIRGL